MALQDTLTQELASISATYDEHFAGQSRQSRDLGLLEQLTGRVRAVLGQVQQIPDGARGAELRAVTEEATRLVDMYESERKAIQSAKEAGPSFEPFAQLATRANFIFARYGRHYAGQSRTSRDELMLQDMVEELVKLHASMTELAGTPPKPVFKGDLDLVEQNIGMYRKEAEAISQAQTTGTAEDRANLLGGLANNQFALYRTHFAGAARVTRRPGLLVRIIDGLEIIEDRMNRLASGGLTADFHTKNIAVVRAQLDMYKKELDEIRASRRGTPIAELMAMLGGTANELFSEYRDNYPGKARTSVDRERLGSICDRLYEVLRQMQELGRAESNQDNDNNQSIVMDQLSHFEQEFEEVTKAQAKN